MTGRMVASICPYCAVGCGYYIEVEDDRAVGIKYMPNHPTNEGALCPKGNAILDVLKSKDRLRYPMKRAKDDWERISWDEALNLVAEGLKKSLKEHGPASLGFLASSRCNNEENYLFQKMARLLGSPNIDNCARLCHAPSVVGLGGSLGTSAMTNNIADLANSKCIFAIGTNFAETQPLASRWVLRAKERGAKVVVADPRITSTSWMADLHLTIRPGTDMALLRGMMRAAIEEGLVAQDFIERRTMGFDDLSRSLEGFSVEEAAEACEVPVSDIRKATRLYARSPASALLYSMGITQHICGTENVRACTDLALLCGQVGRAGTGIMPMRGQNNVQGACDMGAMAEFYPGYRRSSDPESIELFKVTWNAPNLPLGPGLTSMEMMEAAVGGSLKAMYIIGEDPVVCDPNTRKTRKALESLEFLVVQEIFMTETAKMADVVLPAAAWAEKKGSYTSMERRVQWIDRAISAPGKAREGLSVICEVADRLGLGFGQMDASTVLEEINRLIPFYRGMTKERIRETGGLLWPCPSPDHPGTEILHAETFPTPDGRAKIEAVRGSPPAEETSPDYPLLLMTGRIVLHYNNASMTSRSFPLLRREGDLRVEMNCADASGLGISQGDPVIVATRRGEVEARAEVTEKVKPGVVFMPFHFNGANVVTSDALDPVSKIPEYKAAACRISMRS
ncbi:MAG: formate dehydrogenase subunit alpha [Euryarchaeota archaeon]|nr:formate dehydrogenase subunit alpha [Euryarchaeota archaeon]